MKRWMVLGLGLALLAAACSSSGDKGVVVQDPWGRTSPKVATAAAFYMTLEGGDTADRLVGGDADICGAVEIHQTIITDGVMHMQPAEGGIEIPAGGEAVLEPGGYHVMCINKTVELEAGDVVPLTLVFENAPSQTVEAEIRDN